MDKERNREILEKVIASFLEPIFILAIFQANLFGEVIALILFVVNILILLNDKDTLIIHIVKILFNIK